MNWLVFCSHNGQSTLPAMMNSLRALTWTDWQVLAVDNSSSDDTMAILSRAANDIPMRILSNPQPSKNSGLNLALDWLGDRCHDAELIAFSDDDVIADEQWLAQLLNASRKAPQADIFGGTIEPLWPVSLPTWLNGLEENFDVLYARTHKLHGSCPAHHVYGPNMAIRGRLFGQGHRFDARIGPRNSSSYRMGSETELVERLERLGHQAWFAPQARVLHQVREAQLQADFVFSRARRHGLGKGEFSWRASSNPGPLPPAAMLARLAASEFKLLLTLLPIFRNRRQHVRYGREWLRGFARGYRDAVSNARAQPGNTD